MPAVERPGERDVEANERRRIGLRGGWHVLARLKESPSVGDVPVVVCTAGDGRDHAAVLGAADFVAKPFSMEQLREVITRVLPPGATSVLVVDDDEAVRGLVRETIGPIGVTVSEAADGHEAFSAVARRRPDAIVLDLVMPRVDGFVVLERLQADPGTRSIRVVVLTAHRLSADERRVLRDRAASLLEKSAYSAGELRRLIRQAVGHQPLDRGEQL